MSGYDDIFPGVGPQKSGGGYDDIFAPKTPQDRVRQMAVNAGQASSYKLPPTEDPGALKTILIGAGRTGDQVSKGMQQLYLNSLIAAKEGAGVGDPRAQFDALNKLDAENKANTGAYNNLKTIRPFATGIGEAAPSMAVPASQATALGRITAPALGMGAIGGMSYGSPEERAMMALKDAGMGLAGGSMGELAARFMSPAKSSLTGAKLDAVNSAAKNLGVKTLPSQVTGNQYLASLEDMLSQSMGSAGVMRKFAQDNGDKLSQKAADAIGYPLIPGQGLTDKVLGAAKDTIGAERNKLTQRANMPVTQDVIDAANKAAAKLSTGDAAGKAEALASINKLKDDLFANKSFDGDLLSTWVSDLKSRARGSQSDVAASQLKDVAKALENAGMGADKPLWMENNKQYAALKTLMRPNVVDEVSGTVNPKVLYNALQNQFGDAWKTGKISGALADIADFGKALPELRAGSQTYQRGQADSLGAYLMALPKYAAAKGLTSDFMRDYLSRGLLLDPQMSQLGGAGMRGLLTPIAAGSTVPAAGLLGWSQ